MRSHRVPSPLESSESLVTRLPAGRSLDLDPGRRLFVVALAFAGQAETAVAARGRASMRPPRNGRLRPRRSRRSGARRCGRGRPSAWRASSRLCSRSSCCAVSLARDSFSRSYSSAASGLTRPSLLSAPNQALEPLDDRLAVVALHAGLRRPAATIAAELRPARPGDAPARRRSLRTRSPPPRAGSRPRHRRAAATLRRARGSRGARVGASTSVGPVGLRRAGWLRACAQSLGHGDVRAIAAVVERRPSALVHDVLRLPLEPPRLRQRPRGAGPPAPAAPLPRTAEEPHLPRRRVVADPSRVTATVDCRKTSSRSTTTNSSTVSSTTTLTLPRPLALASSTSRSAVCSSGATTAAPRPRRAATTARSLQVPPRAWTRGARVRFGERSGAGGHPRARRASARAPRAARGRDHFLAHLGGGSAADGLVGSLGLVAAWRSDSTSAAALSCRSSSRRPRS